MSDTAAAVVVNGPALRAWKFAALWLTCSTVSLGIGTGGRDGFWLPMAVFAGGAVYAAVVALLHTERGVRARARAAESVPAPSRGRHR